MPVVLANYTNLFCKKIFYWFGVFLLLILFFSCSQEGSPFTVDAANHSPFGVHTRQILNSLRYLPDDPADMSASDLKFFRNKPWVVIEAISSKFTPKYGKANDFYQDFDIRMSHMKYLIHTRAFADEIVERGFAMSEKKSRPFALKEQELRSSIYRKLDTEFHIHPLEILLLLRNMHYKLRVANKANYHAHTYRALLGKMGRFEPKIPFTGWDPIKGFGTRGAARQYSKIPFTGWDPIKDGGFKPEQIVWLNSTKVIPDLMIHEILHNWGYNHTPLNQDLDAPYRVQLAILKIYIVDNPPRKKLYEQHSKSGKLPTIFNVKKTAKLTTKYDQPKPKPKSKNRQN